MKLYWPFWSVVVVAITLFELSSNCTVTPANSGSPGSYLQSPLRSTWIMPAMLAGGLHAEVVVRGVDARSERDIGDCVQPHQRAAGRADAVAELEVSGRLHFVHGVRAGPEIR